MRSARPDAIAASNTNLFMANSFVAGFDVTRLREFEIAR
jgi:hypothetical protein